MGWAWSWKAFTLNDDNDFQFLECTRPTLAEALGQPTGATIAWAHFLAFDLFVGRWAYLDSREKGITAWVASPLLFFILMVGPLGFLLYLLGRTAVLRQRS
jgi:hypothetical protein